MREKFTTTLSKNHKQKLSILSASKGMDRNEWIEMIVDIEWGKFINEVGNKKDRRKDTE